eukprot:m.131325 g.131325  ORF g.131325 m.131325 type:complete len:54 (+) comp9477_c0_seq1:2518-2679(+)
MSHSVKQRNKETNKKLIIDLRGTGYKCNLQVEEINNANVMLELYIQNSDNTQR